LVVEELLRSRGISFRPSGRDYLIKCLNPNHDDSNPSLRIDKISGLGHCFACGWRLNLYKKFDEVPPVNSIRLAKLKDKIKMIKDSLVDIEFPDGYTPYNHSYRGISATTLKRFEAFSTELVEELKDRIVFPIRNMYGKIVVFNGRQTHSDEGKKYTFYPRHISPECYPVIIPNEYNSIIIVEGIFDMLNLQDKGLYNAVSVFGTQALKNNTANKLLPYKVQAIQKIFILFDGDDAGRTAATEIEPLLIEHGFMTEIIELPDGVDPGIMNVEQIDQIKEYIK
jgi:DNA primase